MKLEVLEKAKELDKKSAAIERILELGFFPGRAWNDELVESLSPIHRELRQYLSELKVSIEKEISEL